MKPRLSCLVLALVSLSWTAQGEELRPAPSCSIPALDGAAQIDPAAYKGQVVYLDFWASWCIPCAKSFPFMNELHAQLGRQGLQIIAINLDETQAEARGFLAKQPADFAIGLDPEGRCPRLYGVKGMPTSYLIDRRGNIRHVHRGFKTSDIAELRVKIDGLLAEP
ncbi:TlpA family protein disulfide reductase [Caldichromatium japonicum]|uniref:TlpA family protein disulfide reductase n=1 Tax=Caldichromatium japonicum TaxID=2699430 RepID=A0A6G7VCC9_9GAMM|nr:TlpA disulfide reductase family protein [Caldichromatium japonicum]QIK37535.1 TlpA family protein disulfide reductase [Caldichromatium japonicum]